MLVGHKGVKVSCVHRDALEEIRQLLRVQHGRWTCQSTLLSSEVEAPAIDTMQPHMPCTAADRTAAIC